jgi:two-component system, NtrC family, sensor histidine kinase KinB
VTLYQQQQKLAFERTRLAALLESNMDGVMLVNLDGEFGYANESVWDLLGLPLNTAVWQGQKVTAVGEQLHDSHPEFCHLLHHAFGQLRTGNEPPSQGEFITHNRHLHWYNRPVMSEQITLGRLITLRDVTQERLLEQLRDDLIHTAIHDLRNPIAAISGCINMLKAETDPKAQAELLKIMQRGTQGLQELVNTILDISQLEHGQMPLNLLPVNLAQVVGDVVQLQDSLARYYQIRVHNLVPRDTPEVLADVTLIKRVLQNLLDNALKFTPAGGEVTISTAVDSTANKLHLTIHDTGPGIPPHLQAKIFDRFATGRQEGSGNGLGLTFCKMAIERHGETIELISSPGAGTMFMFSLPLAIEQVSLSASQQFSVSAISF